MFIREKKTAVGKYHEFDLIPRTDKAEQGTRRTRNKKKRVSRPSQENLNTKNSRRYLVQLLNGNFGKEDYHLSCTYSPKYLPKTVADAEREVSNYLLRIKRKRISLGLDPLKYVVVTEYSLDQDNNFVTRIHHHIVTNGGIDRNLIEDLWGKGQGKNRESMGFVNADRLQVDPNTGLEALGKYLVKTLPNSQKKKSKKKLEKEVIKNRVKGKKRWSSSRNLLRPERLPNADHKFRPSAIERMARSNDLGYSELIKKYPNYYISEVRVEEHRMTGYHIYIKAWKKERDG